MDEQEILQQQAEAMAREDELAAVVDLDDDDDDLEDHEDAAADG